MNPPHPFLSVTRVLTLAAYSALFLLLMAWNTVLAPKPNVPTAISLLIIVGPLLLPMRGVLDRKPISHIWLALLALVYFIFGVTSVYSDAELRLLAGAEIFLSVMLFFSALFF
ncbi:MAG TPA: DUF2069 domain-containing protein, partial [Gammaproteobacteria bacterium]|nr:DUF2069 domain-containing protein [Gammaproteobacteria bacterium]